MRHLCLWCGIAGPLLVFLTAVLAVTWSPGYNPLSDTISDLAAQDAPHPQLMRAGLIAFGLLTVAFAAGLATTVAVQAGLMHGLVSGFGLGVTLLGIFQDYSEAPGAPRNLEGFLHNTFGLVAIASLLGSMIILEMNTREDARWRPFAETNRVTMLIVLITAALFLRGPKRVEGLDELILFGATLAWMGRLARHALREQRNHPTPVEHPASGRYTGAEPREAGAPAPSPGDG